MALGLGAYYSFMNYLDFNGCAVNRLFYVWGIFAIGVALHTCRVLACLSVNSLWQACCSLPLLNCYLSPPVKYY